MRSTRALFRVTGPILYYIRIIASGLMSPANGYPPPPPGALSGGPNFNPDDPAANNANLMSLAPSKRYLDDIESYTTNEVTINWNAPLVWVATFLDWTVK